MDTHAAFKDLTATGFDERQAEALVAFLERVHDATVTLKDLDAQEKDIRTEMRELEFRLTLRMGAGFAITLGALVPLVVLT